MLDHVDHNQERILVELTSDSAISDISSHKPTSQSSSGQISRYSDVKRSHHKDESSNILEMHSSPGETASSSSVRTVKHPRSPRRNCKTSPGASNNLKMTRHPSGDTSIPRLSNISYRSPTSSSTIATKQRITPEKRTVSSKPSQIKSLLTGSTSTSPQSQQRTTKKENVVGLTIENVSKLHKQFELETSEYNTVDLNDSLPVPFVEELLSEFQGLKDKLEQLQLQLETQESREREKDELIQRLTGEVECLKSVVGREGHHNRNRNGKISILGLEPVDVSEQKENIVNSLLYENAAVQTDSNNIFNNTVNYSDEEDKYGEIVSFRIGRAASVRKKL